MNHLQTRKEILSQIFPDCIIQENKHEFITWCPNPSACNGKHHKKKLQINFNENVFSCWVCGYSGFITKLLAKHAPVHLKKRYLATLPVFEDYAESNQACIELPKEYRFLFDALDDKNARVAYDWLIENCQTTNDVIFQQKIGFCASGDYKNRIIFPSYDIDGKLNVFVARSIWDDAYIKYLNCENVKTKDVIFNEILIDWRQPLILVEGVKSHIKHFSIPNVVPILGSRFSKNHQLFYKSILNDVPEVFVALDNQAITKSYDIMDYYFSFGVNVKIVNLSDVNQPDCISTEEFCNRIAEARPFCKKDKLKINLRKIA